MEARLGPVLDALDDGADAPLVILALARAPFMTHGTLRVVCRRLRTIIASRAFREWRVERGLAEYGLVVAGGKDILATTAAHHPHLRLPVLILHDGRAGNRARTAQRRDRPPPPAGKY